MMFSSIGKLVWGMDLLRRGDSSLGLPPPPGVFKFNVDGASRGNLGHAGIGGVLRNCKGKVLFMFYKNVGVYDLNEAKILAILEGLRLFSSRFFCSCGRKWRFLQCDHLGIQPESESLEISIPFQ
eukprot:TRINITY_DN19084_c1_g1_i1.p1 TRINITY_DN19084_c1_g1~~TRINITY_DN19084_c1_g1_i1.p1  ORF type:complete len:125 (+),score=13.77 TRINITY_DN19084_c1_g1_i1:826-1200(+)